MAMKPLVALVTIAACSPYSVATTPPPITAFGPAASTLGTICVIRQSVFAQAVTFAIHDNGQLVGATRGDSYFCYLAQPGAHAIVSDTGDSTDHPGTTTLDVQPNQRYWLQQDHHNSFGSITSELLWIDKSRAQELVTGCEYLVIVEAPGHEALPAPVPLAFAR
jgi:hypothetical protein